jgi:hypothetical protein
VGSLEALNATLAAADAATVPAASAAGSKPSEKRQPGELPLLTRLSAERFDVALRLSCRVDAKGRICVRQSYYSVPALTPAAAWRCGWAPP